MTFCSHFWNSKISKWLFGLDTKIWWKVLSFGCNFGHLRAIGPNRLWCYFMVHIFQIKNSGSILSIGSWNIARSLKISFGFNVREILAGSISGIHLSNKKKIACNYLYPFSSYRTQKFCVHTNRRILTKSFGFFFLIKNI